MCKMSVYRRSPVSVAAAAIFMASQASDDKRSQKGIHLLACFFTYKLLIEYTHTRTQQFNGPFPGLPGWAGTRKVKPIWILVKQATVSGNGISWAICKSAPCSRQITVPAPHHSVFYRPDAFLPPNQQRQWLSTVWYILMCIEKPASLLWHSRRWCHRIWSTNCVEFPWRQSCHLSTDQSRRHRIFAAQSLLHFISTFWKNQHI